MNSQKGINTLVSVHLILMKLYPDITQHLVNYIDQAKCPDDQS